MKKIELLAPVGNQDNLEAAIHAGADAVYLAGKQFGARKSAKNFDKEGIIKAIRDSHLNGLAVYVTVNTLIKPSERKAMYQWIDFLYQEDVDAVIVQDLAVFRYIQAQYPDLPCHASTQMTCHHLGDVLLAQEMGFKRVVLARELSLEEIINIHEKTEIELEFFVHGALCVSYSGQCLMSSSIGGRSGNRGACAQPCRQAYDLKRRSDDQVVSQADQPFILSPKDVNALSLIDNLKKYDRISLKIEGRMKRVDYVYSVVNAYRQKIDEQPVEIKTVERAFNRGYSLGHLGQAPYHQLMNYQSPSHHGTLLGKVINYKQQTLELRLFDDIHKSDEIQIRRSKTSVGTRADMIFKGGERVKEAYTGDVVKIPFKHPVKKNEMVYKTYDTAFVAEMNQLAQTVYPLYGLQGRLIMKIGQKACLQLSDDQGLSFEGLSETFVEKAIHKPLSEERILTQLSKLGGTLFYLSQIEMDLDDQALVSVSELNRMRRQVIACFEEAYSLWHPERQKRIQSLNHEIPQVESNDSALEGATQASYDYVIDDINFIKNHPLKGNDRYILSHLKDYQDNMAWCIEKGIIPMLPKIIRESDWPRIDRWLKAYDEVGGQSIMIRQMGTLKHLRNGMRLILDSPFNILNGDSLQAYKALARQCNQDLDTVYLSNEVSLEEIKEMHYEKSDCIGIAMFGHLELMTSEYCAVGGVLHGHDHCGECSRHDFYIEDHKQRQFPLALDNVPCRMTVLSPMPINEFDQLKTCLKQGIKRYKIDLRHLQNDQMRDDLYQKRFSAIQTKQRSYLLEAIE